MQSSLQFYHCNGMIIRNDHSDKTIYFPRAGSKRVKSHANTFIDSIARVHTSDHHTSWTRHCHSDRFNRICHLPCCKVRRLCPVFDKINNVSLSQISVAGRILIHSYKLLSAHPSSSVSWSLPLCLHVLGVCSMLCCWKNTRYTLTQLLSCCLYPSSSEHYFIASFTNSHVFCGLSAGLFHYFSVVYMFWVSNS